MTWRVAILPDATIDGVAIQIAHRIGDGYTEVVTFTQSTEIQPAGVYMPQPSLKLEDGLGRALLDALAEHYGNASGGRQQRADFEHERNRVDRLTDAVITLATREAGQ
jgi:hypothetical protein